MTKEISELREATERAVRACRNCMVRKKCMEQVSVAKVVEKRLKKKMAWCTHASQAWALAFIDGTKGELNVARSAEMIAKQKGHKMVLAGDLMIAFAKRIGD